MVITGYVRSPDCFRLVDVIQFWRTDDCCRHYRSLDYSGLSVRCTARTGHSAELSHRATKVRGATQVKGSSHGL